MTAWPTTLASSIFCAVCHSDIETKSVYEIKSDIETNLSMKPGLSIKHERRDNVAVRLSAVSIRTVGIQWRQCISFP